MHQRLLMMYNLNTVKEKSTIKIVPVEKNCKYVARKLAVHMPPISMVEDIGFRALVMKLVSQFVHWRRGLWLVDFNFEFSTERSLCGMETIN